MPDKSIALCTYIVLSALAIQGPLELAKKHGQLKRKHTEYKYRKTEKRQRKVFLISRLPSTNRSP